MNRLKVLHNLDHNNYGGIPEMIFTIYKHSKFQHDFWSARGTMAPELESAGMVLLPGGPDPWEQYDILVGHGVGGWSYDGGFDYARSKGLRTIEAMHSPHISLTHPDLVDAFVSLGPMPDRYNQHMLNRRVIYTPIDTEKFYQREDASLIGRLSRLVEDKNPRPFLDVARRFPGEQFVIAGGRGVAAAEREDYYDLLKASASPNVTFSGYVRDFPEWYSHLKLYVYHTRDECCCASVNMAMCAGIPVICHDHPSLRVTTGGNAVFCATDSDFNDAVDRFLSEPAPFKEMAQSGKQWARAHCNLEATVGEWDRLCESLVEYASH
jgi:glycosyltransferase involved in cell wall biosynthesis